MRGGKKSVFQVNFGTISNPPIVFHAKQKRQGNEIYNHRICSVLMTPSKSAVDVKQITLDVLLPKRKTAYGELSLLQFYTLTTDIRKTSS